MKIKADFDSCLESAGNKLVVVDFFATWCGPCKMISPVLDKLSDDLKEVVVFLKVDVDDNEVSNDSLNKLLFNCYLITILT